MDNLREQGHTRLEEGCVSSERCRVFLKRSHAHLECSSISARYTLYLLGIWSDLGPKLKIKKWPNPSQISASGPSN